MITAQQRDARTALDAARPALSRLDPSRSGEDLAADLLDLWNAVEAALRKLVGSTILSGQPLIREARQRQSINFDQANALADFSAVHERVQDANYRPSAADVASAQAAFLKLDTALSTDAASPAFAAATEQFPGLAGAPLVASTVVSTTPLRRGFPKWGYAIVALVVLALIGGGAYFAFGRRADSLQQGVDAYRAGQREAAVSAFNKAVREDPKAAAPHIYLARMAREVGNFTVSNQELQLALEAEPSNAAALREMGANLFAQNNFELARRFYVRAVEADPADKSALGYLGCTLERLGRGPEAANFIGRAGAGPWTACLTPVAPPATQPLRSR